MHRSEPNSTQPLPDTAELGGEGGSFGDSTTRESKRTSGRGPRPADEVVTDIIGNVTRLPDVTPEDEPAAGAQIHKHSTER